DLDLREMLGNACLAEGELDAACNTFQVLVSMNEARYGSLFPVVEAFIENKMPDKALDCLDIIIPMLISRRETGKAAKLYQSILERDPGHLPTLTKSAALHSATGETACYLEALDRIAEYHLNDGRPIDALECLEKILKEDPENEKYRTLHCQAFSQAYPDVPYTPPAFPEESAQKTMDQDREDVFVSEEKGTVSENIVEVDLLLNYGLKDKALSLLLNLEKHDPKDTGVRTRLLSLYKSDHKNKESAEECLKLAAILSVRGDEEGARAYLDEARQLDPDGVPDEINLKKLAEQQDIAQRARIERDHAKTAHPGGLTDMDTELDLSSDLLSSFSIDGRESDNMEGVDFSETPEEEFSSGIGAGTANKPVDEQLEEVDFYLRLGFNDEALSKLDEISRINPGHPALASRYEKLKGSEPWNPAEDPIISTGDSETLSCGPVRTVSPGIIDTEDPGDLSGVSFQNDRQSGGAAAAARTEDNTNEMFADLMEEVCLPDSPEEAQAFFEDHFSLGLAFRDMDLIDDAIKEFETALKNMDMMKGNPQVIQCCGMLSACFLKKNMPTSALRWSRTGLRLADFSSHEAMAFRYDMGSAHAMSGNEPKAIECFEELFGMDPGYRDVAQRIDSLREGMHKHLS
ncbi:MAG TPA: hypothetical protein VLL97_04725, partial [Acidobacteriota bacterium]|nr:hypothetical protein [Acidobacteriota bacterium]